MRFLLLLSGVAASVAALSLSGPALASPRASAGSLSVPRSAALKTSLHATKSESFAGYSYQVENYSSFTVKAEIVVPKVKCSGSTEKAIAASVGMDSDAGSEFTAAALFVGCYKGKADFFPGLEANGVAKNYDVEAKPGDRIVLVATESASGTHVVATDTTDHRFKRSLNESGNDQLSIPWVGDEGWDNPGLLGVPSFGQIAYSHATLDGKAFGSWGTHGTTPIRWDRVSGSTTQIKTSKLAKNEKSFTTTFEHS